jgi:conjugative transposon TraM protein
MQQQQTHSAAFLRKRKFWTVLPLLVIPFLTLLFWALGGGDDAQAASADTLVQGFNLQLPEAKTPADSNWTKLTYYDKADRDSARLRQLIRNDPYYQLPLSTVETPDSSFALLLNDNGAKALGTKRHAASPADSSEARIYRQLAVIDQQLHQSVNQPVKKEPATVMAHPDPSLSRGHTDVDRLEQMMQAMQTPPSTVDPEIQELSAMVNTLAGIEQSSSPMTAIQKASEQQKRKVFTVDIADQAVEVSMLGSKKCRKNDSAEKPVASLNRFYGLEENNARGAPIDHAIAAIIPQEQMVTTGSIIKLQLSQAVYINGLRIAAGTLVFGNAELSGERLHITVNSIRQGNSILPVSLTVFDLDGLPGLFVPGAITRDVAQQSADQSLSTLGLGSFNPSIGAQAANAGLQAAKNLLSRKVKQVKVTVKAGYAVLLQDRNNN